MPGEVPVELPDYGGGGPRKGHNFGWLIEYMGQQVRYWQSTGTPVAPYAAERIMLLCRRYKLLPEERAFAEQFIRLFVQKRAGATDMKIVARAAKLGLDVSHIEDARPRRTYLPENFKMTGDQELDLLRARVPLVEISIKAFKHEGGTNYWFDFGYHCAECGGYVMTVPDDRPEDGPAICKACGVIFGRFGDVRVVCLCLGQRELARRGL